MSVFTPTENIVVLGTGPGERWSGKDKEGGAMADDSTTDRREFLRSLGKWSAAAIAAVLLRDSVTPSEASGWVNRRGSWVNGGGGGGWANRGGSWINGGGGWINSRGGGGSWVNRCG